MERRGNRWRPRFPIERADRTAPRSRGRRPRERHPRRRACAERRAARPAADVKSVRDSLWRRSSSSGAGLTSFREPQGILLLNLDWPRGHQIMLLSLVLAAFIQDDTKKAQELLDAVAARLKHASAIQIDYDWNVKTVKEKAKIKISLLAKRPNLLRLTD